MAHQQESAAGPSNARFYNLNLQNALPSLQQGNLDAQSQAQLAAHLNTVQNDLNQLPFGLFSPAPHTDGDAMDEDAPAFAEKSGSFAAALKKRSGGTLQVLPCTKAMKNRV